MIRLGYLQEEFVYSPPLKILIVDDDHCILELYKYNFEQWGLNIECTFTDSVVNAEKYLKDNSPDLSIFDINVNGTDIRKFIFSSGNYSAQCFGKIILVSGMSSSHIKKTGEIPDGIIKLGKPINFKVIHSLIMNIFMQRLV